MFDMIFSSLRAPAPRFFTLRRHSLIWSAAALVAALAVSGCSRNAGTPPPSGKSVTVGVVEMAPENTTLTTELPGRTTAALSAEIRPQVGGIVKSRPLVEGARVQAGQALYQIDPASYQAAYDSAQAAALKAQATMEAAQLTVQRQEALLKIDATSQQSAQDARTALKQAQADVASTKAAAQTARIALDRTVVRSPIAGVADVSTVTTGALVTADQATALTTVRQLHPMQVDILQSSTELLQLKKRLMSGKGKAATGDAAAVQLILEDGSVYAHKGTLSVQGVSVNTSTGGVTLKASFPNPDGLLLPGMYVRAVLPTDALDQALLVPQQAVSRDSRNGSSVLVVNAEGKVEKRNVTLDRTVGNRWLLSAGLQTGERVIVEGNQKVRPGDTVKTQKTALPLQDSPAQAPAAPASSTR